MSRLSQFKRLLALDLARLSGGSRRRSLNIETLEQRAMFAASELVMNSLLPETAGEMETSTIVWQGEKRSVNAGHWIVAMDGLPTSPASKLAAVDKELKQLGSGPAIKSVSSLGGRGSLLIETEPNVHYAELQASLSKLPGFRYVEPDFTIHIDAAIPNDPRFPDLYGMNNVGQSGGSADIDAAEAWDITIGSRNNVVGVIDSGVDYAHPDLIGNMWTNPGEIAGDRIDNDANGYIDDVHGYDFANGDGDPMDDNGHGTHVSGTIGATGNNGLGVAGVNWQVQIMALKFLGSNGSGAISAAVSALNYATMMHNNYGVNVQLTNNSWGGGAFSQALSDAIAASGNAGMLFVAAAGNNASNNDTTVSYPAGYNLPNVISVAATDQYDVLASFSNFGATTVDLAAPGVSIVSTMRNNSYGSMSGTSMASPHVSGVAALAWSVDPNASYQKVRDAMYAGVDTVSGLSGKTATGGRLNARKTLDLMATDVGDTLATARVTQLASPAAGDHLIIPSSTIGDGTFANRDVDLYKIIGVPGSTFTVTTSQPSVGGSMNTLLRLFDSAGAQVAVNDDFEGLYSQINYTFPTAGAYYVGVSGAGNTSYNPGVAGSGVAGSGSGVYRLDMSLDVGDTLATASATGIALTGTFTRSSTTIGDGVLGVSDVDMFKISGAVGSTLSAITSQPASVATGVDTVLQIFDSFGNEVAINDNSNGLYSQINYTLPATGVYYVGVSGADSTGVSGTGSTGDYSLKLALYSPAEFELSRLVGGDGSQGFLATGAGNYSELSGPSQYMEVGDVNGDSIDDFLLGAPGDIGATSMTIGQVYLIFGTSGGFPAALNLQSLNGTNGYSISGISLGDRTGFAGGGAGDVNGDNISDLVIGAIWGNPDSTRLKAGQSFVLYGGANLAALDTASGGADGKINLADLTATNGDNGFTINGVLTNDNAGRPTGVGDINADGFDDLLIGAFASGTTGKDYVVFGKASFPPVLELSTIATGDGGFVIPAIGASDSLGIAVSGAGDINGDNIDDMILGASGFDLAGKTNAGQAYVIFGKDTAIPGNSFPASFSLSSLNGTNGFIVNGNAASDSLGNGVTSAGDVNNDGFDDVLIGATGGDYAGNVNSGTVYMIFGKAAFSPIIEVATLDGVNGTAFQGVAAFNNLGESVSSAGDFNWDGYDDILVGSRSASPNGIASAGQSYLVYGGPRFAANFELSSLLASNGGDGSNGIAFNGFQSGATAFRVNGIGDVNSDGYSDLRIGAPYFDNEFVAPGQAYVVFGKPSRPSIRVLSPSGLVTTESGGTATFSVTLTTPPTSDVTIPISSSDLTEGTISINSLTFTPANWSVPQVVVIAGVNDNYSDNEVRYSIPLGAASSGDLAYNGIDPMDVSVTNADNDIFTTTFLKTQNSSIPDPGTLTSSLTVANVGTILDLNVLVNINHTWDEDLDVFLVAPDGTRVELFTDVGGLGVNFTNTLLDDEATALIASGVAPFTGTYKPEGNLASFEGRSLAGVWKLEVTDDTRADRGTLLNWSIIARYASSSAGPKALVTPTSGLVTTESGGTASFTVKLDTAPTSNVTIPVSSNDTTEGSVSTSSLVFTPLNWNVAQAVTITGIDDNVVDSSIAYSIVLGAATSTDPDFNGLNPTDVSVTNTDNETPPTKFYVVNDGSPDRTFEYGTTGSSIENYALDSGNTASRGIASNLAGDKVWVADANRKVYVYNTSGGLLGSWTAGTLASNAQVEGITVFGTDVWIVDNRTDRVLKYSAAAGLVSGTANSSSSFNLNGSNTNAKGIVTDGTSIWVINDSTTDRVFKYNMTGTLLGSWAIDAANSSPTGLTIDPSNVSNIWTVDSGTKRIYQYNAVANKISGSQSASVSYALAANNSNPQDIADLPVGGTTMSTSDSGTEVTAMQSSKRSVERAYDLALLEMVSESFDESLSLTKRLRRAR